MTSEMRRILGDEGELLARDVNLHRTQLLEFWRFMLLGRELDRALDGLRTQGRLGPYISSAGTEACAVGVAAAMKPRDWLFPSWRMTAAALVRDLSLEALVDNALGNERDRARGRQGPGSLGFAAELVAPVSGPVGTQIAQAVGTAHAAHLRGDQGASVALFGSGAWESGDYHSGLNFAGVLRAPVVFVALGRDDLYETAAGYGIAAERVCGDDVLAVFAAVGHALERARAGAGPTLVAAIGGESDRGIELLRRHLLAGGILDAKLEKAMESEARLEVSRAVDSATALGMPATASLFDDVTEEPGAALLWQRQALLDYGGEYGGNQDPEAENILG